MFKHSGDGPKLLRSHVFFENQYIWNGVTTGLSKLCMACLNNGDSSLCRYGTSCFYGILELQMVPAACPFIVRNAWVFRVLRYATWRSDAATLRGCFVNWWPSPASPLKSFKQLCSIRSCNYIRYSGPLSRASCTCHGAWTSGYMWVACTFTIRKRSCTEQLVISPEMKSFGDCLVVACRFGILIADLSGPHVRL